MLEIADTGVIVALLARNDPFHRWAAESFRQHAPFSTCEAVIAEAASFFPDPTPVFTLIERADLILNFNLKDQLPPVSALVRKYADRPMDLADACIVRMTELHRESRVWTVDRADFTIYRRHGRETVHCEFPPVP